MATEYYSDDLYQLPEVAQANAVPASAAPEVGSKSAVLMEASTGKVLFEKNSHEKLSPASITKIMTLLIIIEAIDKGKISMKDVVATSPHAASMGGSQIWLEPKETMTVNELLRAAAIASANDASVALAEFIAGSEEAFVDMMNQRAKELGMKDTVFKNACGLDTEGHYTSAMDVALASRELISHDTIKQFSTVWMDSLRGGQTQLVNTNKLVRFYQGCTGLKTGTTSKAGFCLSATAKRGEMELVSVVMNSPSGDDRFNSARKLLDYGFANWNIAKPQIDEKSLADVKVLHGTNPAVGIDMSENKSILIKKGDEKKITTKINVQTEISAPVKEGQILGNIDIMMDNQKIGTVDLYAVSSVDKVSFMYSLTELLKRLFTL
ncbi:MAG: D-alanyl-D-alanine carboxypeptidase [Clostridiales bacterium 43-6]|nr:MAG: D-alanyl-D-alanine carboxypeptidase [Clostridiales bacterium 43-6]